MKKYVAHLVDPKGNITHYETYSLLYDDIPSTSPIMNGPLELSNIVYIRTEYEESRRIERLYGGFIDEESLIYATVKFKNDNRRYKLVASPEVINAVFRIINEENYFGHREPQFRNLGVAALDTTGILIEKAFKFVLYTFIGICLLGLAAIPILWIFKEIYNAIVS